MGRPDDAPEPNCEAATAAAELRDLQEQEQETMAEFHKADIEKLIDGVLPWPATRTC